MDSPKQLIHSLHSFPFGGEKKKEKSTIGQLMEEFCPFMVTIHFSNTDQKIVNLTVADLRCKC